MKSWKIKTAGFVAATALATLGVRAASVTVDQSGQHFSETSLTVKPGDTVVYANRDDVIYNISVIDQDDDADDLGLQKPGQVLSYRFTKLGRFKVRCSIHPSMRMTVNVR